MRLPQECQGGPLTSVTIDPGNVSLQGGASQVFTAVARNSCGGSLTNLSNISWSLSRSDLGALSSSWGPSTTYQSCIAPMGGYLVVVANYDGERVSASVAISIWFNYGTPDGAGPTAKTGLNVETVTVLLILAGVAVAVWGYRNGRPPSRNRELSEAWSRSDLLGKSTAADDTSAPDAKSRPPGKRNDPG